MPILLSSPHGTATRRRRWTPWVNGEDKSITAQTIVPPRVVPKFFKKGFNNPRQRGLAQTSMPLDEMQSTAPYCANRQKSRKNLRNQELSEPDDSKNTKIEKNGIMVRLLASADGRANRSSLLFKHNRMPAFFSQLPHGRDT